MSENTTRASLDLLFNVSRELTSDLDLRTVLERALSLSSESIGAERASVVVVDEHQQPVEAAIIVQGHLIPHTVELLRGTVDHGLAGWVLRNREPVLIMDSSQDPRWQQRPDDAAERSGAKSALCVPIITRDQVVGVITLVHPMPHFFNSDHLALLGAIADQAGSAIYNARLHGDLQAAHRRYQELFEDSIDPICITEWNGVVLEANRQAQLLSGHLDSPIRGHHVEELLGLDSNWLFQHEIDLQQGKMVTTEGMLISHSGPHIPVEAYIRRVNINGEDALQWILRDISERKELDSLRETLTEYIVHDLRAPLSNIISSLEFFNMFLPAGDGDTLPEVLSIAKRSADRMLRLITSLLDINRLEKGQSITTREWVDPAPLVYEALDAVQPIAEGKKQVVDIQIESNLPRLWVDHNMIVRVLINLLDNAVKYTPNEGQVALAAQRVGNTVQFLIQDNGPGIPPEEKDTVFNRFYQLRSEHKKTGFGLGLSFCKLAIEAHGGRIWVESLPGQGGHFYFALPFDTSTVSA